MLQQQLPFADEVARHYEKRGYTVHRGRKVRGASGAVYATDLVIQAPFGNLLVSLGDDGEMAGPEVGAVRTAAKDIGANPVVAARRIPPDVRHIATRLGVAVLDTAALEEEAIQAPQLVDPTETWAPWPESPGHAWPTERERPRQQQLDHGVRRRQERFSWLQTAQAPAPAAAASAPAVAPAGAAAARPRQEETTAMRVPLRHIPKPPVPEFEWRAPLLYGTVTGIVGGVVAFLLMLLFL